MLPSAADPYYVARDEVDAKIKKIHDMHSEWKRLLQSENTARSQRFQHLHAEILAELQNIDYDLQDITATITMVEDNRARFNMDQAEIKSRKDFVNRSRASVREMHDSVAGTAATAKIEADKRQILTSKNNENKAAQDRQGQIARDNDAFLDRERQTQMHLIQQQDETLDQIASSAQRLQGAATTISIELKEQAKMLEELDEDIDKETEKLNFVMKRIGRLLQTGDSKQLCLIIALFILMIVLIFLVINA